MIKLTAIQYKEIIHSEERDYIEKTASGILGEYKDLGNDSNLLIVFYVQIMPDDFVMQLHRF